MKSNVRFVVLWAAFASILSTGALLVTPLSIAYWSPVQTGLVTVEINTGSAFVLALVAYLWSKSTKEPAVLSGAVTATAVATIALGNAFHWWSLDDAVGQLVVAFLLAVLAFVLAAFNRSVAYAPETVEIEKAKQLTPAAVFAVVNPKLHPPAAAPPVAPEPAA